MLVLYCTIQKKTCRKEQLESVCSANKDAPELLPHPQDLIKATVFVAPDLKLAWCPVSTATPAEWATALITIQVGKEARSRC